MANLKNINFMDKERFDELTETSLDELYAVESSEIITFPDYSAAVSISGGSYTAPSNGIIKMGYLSAGDNTYSGGVTHSATGQDMVSNYSAYKYSNGGTFWCFVEKGETYTITTAQPNIVFIPLK